MRSKHSGMIACFSVPKFHLDLKWKVNVPIEFVILNPAPQINIPIHIEVSVESSGYWMDNVEGD